MATWIVYQTGELYSTKPQKSVNYKTLLFDTRENAMLYARANGATDVQYK